MTSTSEDSSQDTSAEIAADETSDVARGLSIGAGAAVLFLMLRLLAVADWDWNTAASIMAATDVNDALTIVFGTLMADAAFTGALVALLLPIMLLKLVWPIHGARTGFVDTCVTLALLIAAAVALSATFRYVWVPAGAVVVGLAMITMRLSWRRGRLRRFTDFLFRRAALIAGIGVLALVGVVTTPWVPLEDIVTRTETVHAYVLKAEPGFLTVLTEPDREVRVITTADVIERR